jgi:hypothetical protein
MLGGVYIFRPPSPHRQGLQIFIFNFKFFILLFFIFFIILNYQSMVEGMGAGHVCLITLMFTLT